MEVESQEISWKDKRMRIFIVESSPLARNVYRLLLQRIADCKIVEADDVQAIDTAWLATPPFDLVIVGGRALQTGQGTLRTLLTDLPAWQRLPKIVVAAQTNNGRDVAWHGLENMTFIARPFTPETFIKIIDRILTKHEAQSTKHGS